MEKFNVSESISYAGVLQGKSARAYTREFETVARTWDELATRQATPIPEQNAYIYGELLTSPGSHAAKNVISRTMLSLDYDRAAPGEPQAAHDLLKALKYSHAIFTTRSATEETPKFRVIVPLSESVGPAVFSASTLELISQLSQVVKSPHDPACEKFSQLMFAPWAGAEYQEDYLYTEGKSFQPVGADAPPPRLAGSDLRIKQHPGEIKSHVGEFNRKYEDIDAVLEAFPEMNQHISFVYDDHYRINYASSRVGLNQLRRADGAVFWYCHHGSSPLHGQTGSMFDLAAFFLGGGVEYQSDREPQERDYVQAFENSLIFKKALAAKEDPADAAPEPPSGGGFVPLTEDGPKADRSARQEAKQSRKSSKEARKLKFMKQLREEDPFLNSIRRTRFAESLMVEDADGKLVPRTMIEMIVELREHVAETYDEALSQEEAKTLIRYMSTSGDMFNHVLAELDSTKWDGIKRINRFLIPTHMDPEYADKAITLQFLGAANRVLNPGSQLDTALVLVGAAGVGKSTFLQSLALGYYMPVTTMGKDVQRALATSFIADMDEMRLLRVGMNKSKLEAVKSFITQKEDALDIKYQAEMSHYPRVVSFWGTTNDGAFIPPMQGARRFLPYHISGPIPRWADEEPDFFRQVWAEALARVRAGELEALFADEAGMAAFDRMANETRVRYTDDDLTKAALELFQTAFSRDFAASPRLVDADKANYERRNLMPEDMAYLNQAPAEVVWALLFRTAPYLTAGFTSSALMDALRGSALAQEMFTLDGSIIRYTGPTRPALTARSSLGFTDLN